MGLFDIFWGIFIFGFIIFELWFLFFSDLSRKGKKKKDTDGNDV